MDYLNSPFTAPWVLGNISVSGKPGGIHDTIICDDSGLLELHTSFYGTNGFVKRDTFFGQTRITDFCNPSTGQVFR
ncbi:hypothetical protein JW905_02525 [bacterium]|nr:hypothetical protein [candidate division CSSED10-310 bacterium]